VTTVTITINTSNAAFDDDSRTILGAGEIARILRVVADDFERDGVPRELRDINGNFVGRVKLS
jgi:hypothetical protein